MNSFVYFPHMKTSCFTLHQQTKFYYWSTNNVCFRLNPNWSDDACYVRECFNHLSNLPWIPWCSCIRSQDDVPLCQITLGVVPLFAFLVKLQDILQIIFSKTDIRYTVPVSISVAHTSCFDQVHLEGELVFFLVWGDGLVSRTLGSSDTLVMGLLLLHTKL